MSLIYIFIYIYITKKTHKSNPEKFDNFYKNSVSERLRKIFFMNNKKDFS